ncbi:MAG: GreA/GreB family elongation factor [Patescibacteria group bacterium]
MEEKKYYLTKKGSEKIKKEYDDLKERKLFKVREEAPRILYSEDLNPEYISFREDLTFIETRLMELENILKNTVVIKAPSGIAKKEVHLGATVTLEEKDGSNNEFMIVGTLEANPGEGKISSESPVGKALLGNKIGDEVIINSPVTLAYKIKKVKYEFS